MLGGEREERPTDVRRVLLASNTDGKIKAFQPMGDKVYRIPGIMASQESRAASNREKGQSLNDIRAVVKQRGGSSFASGQVSSTNKSSERQWTTS